MTISRATSALTSERSIRKNMVPFFKKSIIGFSCLLFSFTSFSQKFTGSFDFQLAIPQGEYRENNEDAGLGARFNVLWRPKETIPVKLGLELGYQTYGSNTERFDAYLYGFYETYKVTASSNVFSFAVTTRLQSAKAHKLKPFLDGLFGWNVFFSTVNVERLTDYSSYNNNNNDSYGNSTKGRWAFTYGAAAGLDIPLDKHDDFGLEIKCSYMFGADTRYLTNPQIDNTGTAYFTEKQSETNMIIPQLGLRINL